ncbi:MAG: transcription termination/antitermination NusG family protein [Pseudomonadota bacterium]
MNTHPTGRRWYVAATQPYKENLAEQQLHKQRFQTYLPKRIKTVRKARRNTDRIVSFFPGYIFVELDLDRERWRSVNGTFGVRSLIMGGQRPLPVPNGLVEQLHQMTDAEGFLRLCDDLNCGDEIRILNGPMAEMIGKIDRLDGKHRVRVLLEILHSRVPTVVPVENVVKRRPAISLSPRTPTRGRATIMR